MWPEINLKKRYLENWGYRVRQLPEKDAIIKEIIMIYADYESVPNFPFYSKYFFKNFPV